MNIITEVEIGQYFAIGYQNIEFQNIFIGSILCSIHFSPFSTFWPDNSCDCTSSFILFHILHHPILVLSDFLRFLRLSIYLGMCIGLVNN